LERWDCPWMPAGSYTNLRSVQRLHRMKHKISGDELHR